MKLHFILNLFLSLTLTSCNNSSITNSPEIKKSNNAVIQDTITIKDSLTQIIIEKSNTVKLSFYYVDEFDNLTIITNNNDSNQLSQKTIYSKNFIILNYSLKELRIPFVIEPGDSITIAFSPNDKPFVKSSKYKKEQLYNIFTIMSDSNKALFTTSNLFLMNPKGILFEENYKIDSAFISKNISGVKDSNSNYYINCLDYLKCQYYLQKSIINRNNDISFLLANPSYLKYHNFRNLLTEYEFFRNSKTTNTQGQIIENSYKSAKLKTGELKDYLLYYTISWMKSKNQVLFKKYYPEFVNDCKNTIYLQKVNDEMVRVNNKNSELELISYSTTYVTSFDRIIAKNKGKIVVIDFWASWCMPCRASMQEYPKIQNKYLNSPVSFVFISIDEKQIAWENAVKEENLFSIQNNFLINNPKNSSLLKKYSINEIPRYLIFDKNGKLVQLTAPSPESNEFDILISKLLENQ